MKVKMNKIDDKYFSVSISKHGHNAFWVEVKSFRPPNAPAHKSTAADIKRRKIALNNNASRLKRKYFYSLPEALEEARRIFSGGLVIKEVKEERY